MAESNVKIDSNNQSFNEDRAVIKLNKRIHFSNVQIENLLKLHSLINLEPQNCVSLVSSILKLENIEVNYLNFWLADILAVVVKNIQLAHMNVLQGTIVIRWILHFMSLVVGEEKLNKTELFENLRESIKVGLANAEEFMIPLPNSTECSKHVTISILINSQKSRKTDNNINVTSVQIATFILNTIREIFWDDFKYNVIQLAFEVNSIQSKEISYSIRPVEPLYRSYDDGKNNEKDAIKEKSYDCRSAAIMDRYFLRKFDWGPSLSSTLGEEYL